MSPSPPPAGRDRDPTWLEIGGSLAFAGVAFRLDPAGTVTQVFGAGLPGLDVTDLQGRRFDAVIPPAILQASDLPTRIGEALSTRLPVHVPRVVIGEGLTARHLRVRIAPVPGRSAEVVVLLDDVTEAVEAVVRAERQACQARTAVLAANVAHEMRNPLSALSLAFQVVASSPGDPRHGDVLRKVQAQVGRLDRIVEDLVEFSRPPSPTRSVVDLASAARDAVLAAAPAARVHVDGPALTLADPSLLHQGLAGLLAEAAAVAARPDGVEVRVGPGPRLTVSDDGPPVPTAARARLFDPFSRVRTRTGSGLVLALARTLLEAMGGTLELASPPGDPTTFRVSLPAPGDPSPSPGGSAGRTG